MCPMIKEGDPPVSYDLLEEARRNLDRDHGFALGEEDGRTVLLVRVPESKPNPFHACEVVSFGIAQDDLVAVKDVFLIGDDRVVRVEPSTLEDLVEERLEEDPQVAEHLRNRLDRGYDYTVFRHKGARDHLRLGVRVPRERVDAVSDEDREALTEVLSPILSSPKGRKVRAYYLVGDEHARRLARGELVDLVGPALEEAVAEQPDPPGPEDEPEVETEPPQGADTLDAPQGSGGSPSPGSSRAGGADDAGAEILGSESSGSPSPAGGAADETAEDPSPSPASGHGGAPSGTTGGGEDFGGPGLGDPDPDPASADPDETGAEFLGSGPSEEETTEPSEGPGAPAVAGESGPAADGPESTPSGTPSDPPADPPAGGAEPAPSSGSPRTSSSGAEPEPTSGDRQTSSSGPEPEPTSGGTEPSPSGAEPSSSGSADRPSPDDGGIAGIAGRAGQVDRPDPDDAPDPDEAGEPGDDLIIADEDEPPAGDGDAVTAEVDQAPGGQVPSPATSEEAAASRADAFADAEADDATPSAQGPSQTSGSGGAPSSAEDAPQVPETGAPTPSPEPAEDWSASEDPAPKAAHRLAEAGYEVVEDVEAGGQPFDFAADRSGGKRLLGLAVPSLDPGDVEALAEAGREAGADAVLAIPLETERGAREASWGTVVDLVPPDAAASLEL